MANRFPLIVDSSNQNIKELPDGDSLLLGDSEKLILGDGTDLSLYHDGSNSYLTNATGALKLATETSGIAITIGHTTSETTIGDNLVVTGNLSVGGVTLPETIADTVGAMVTSNTESGIAVTYDDADNTLDFTVGTLNQNTTGSAATLTTPRGINGVNFDGSADITVTAAAGTLSGNTLASGVTASSLTSVGTLTGLTTAGATINTNALRLASLDTSVNSGESIGDIEFYSSDSSTGGTGVQAKISAVDDNSFGTSYALSFETGSGASPSEKMRISGAGRVSIDKSAYIKQVAITSSSNAVAWDAAAAANAYHLTTENTTFSAPSNAVEGAIISVEIAQGGTPRTVAWNTIFEFAASTAPTVTATASKTDIFAFRYNGSVWQEIGRVQNMAQT
jgi:hypothetical protein